MDAHLYEFEEHNGFCFGPSAEDLAETDRSACSFLTLERQPRVN